MHGNLLLLLFVQICVIVALSRVVGSLFLRAGQPQVVGEMLAGIMLGPSVLGWLAPGTYDSLFPATSLPYLNFLSQLGVVCFLFLVGQNSPVAVILREAAKFDLVVIGVSEEWGLESRLFGWRPERIARDCPVSLLIVRKDETRQVRAQSEAAPTHRDQPTVPV